MHTADAPLAAVTGVTGFLGRYVVEALCQSGWRVRLLVRSEPMHPQLPGLDADIVLGDLFDEPALARLCEGVDAVIHVAGRIKARNRSQFFAANSDGSENLAKAANKVCPSAKIVHVSSMAARAPELSDYAASKFSGEEALRTNTSGSVIILRPSAIYGPWDRETLPLFQMAAWGRILAPRVPDARVCLIHARDVASAVVAAAENAAGGAVYELSDSNVNGYSWTDIASAAGQVVGRTPKVHYIPASLLRGAGLLSEAVASVTGHTPMITRGKVREMLCADWSSSPEKQPPPEVWRPVVDVFDGFQETLESYEKRNFV